MLLILTTVNNSLPYLYLYVLVSELEVVQIIALGL